MKDQIALLTAVVAIVVLLLAGGFALTVVGVEEPAWSRYVYLLGLFEALGFAAAGWLWGREVHRAQVRAAEEKLDKKDEALTAAEKEAARQQQRVKSLAGAVKAATGDPVDDKGGRAPTEVLARIADDYLNNRA